MNGRSLELPDIDALIDAALAEDLGEVGDRTTDAVIPSALQAEARLVAREALVVAGLGVAAAVFRRLDARAELIADVDDGDEVAEGDRIARVLGPARTLLRGERTALNFLTRMSGVASTARAAVREVEGTGVRVLDTRKTIPGWRALDKYAVAAGGGENHRMGLYDQAMLKDTHLAVAGSIAGAVRRLLGDGLPPSSITVEVRSPQELEQAIAAGAGRALLDNMDLETLRRCVEIGSGKIALEASGGLRPGALREVAATGVDAISLGFLTHSAPTADIAMEMLPVR